MYGGGMIESLRRRQKNLNALRARGAPQSEINAMAATVNTLKKSINLKRNQAVAVNRVVTVANQTVVDAEKVAAAVNNGQPSTSNNAINKAKLSQLANTASKLAANIKSLQNMKGGRRRRRTHRRRN